MTIYNVSVYVKTYNYYKQLDRAVGHLAHTLSNSKNWGYPLAIQPGNGQVYMPMVFPQKYGTLPFDCSVSGKILEPEK